MMYFQNEIRLCPTQEYEKILDKTSINQPTTITGPTSKSNSMLIICYMHSLGGATEYYICTYC